MKRLLALFSAALLAVPLAAAAQSFQYTELKPPQPGGAQGPGAACR